MSTATQTPSEVPNFKIVSKFDGVPIVHDSVTYAQSVLSSNAYTARVYATAAAIANKSYSVATPVLVKTKPLLESADGLAVATFERAEDIFPYPFRTPTQDLIVVKQAKAVYDDRVSPIIQQFSPVISDVVNKTAQINSALGARASATLTTSQDLSHALLDQLRHLAEHGKELPGILIDGVGKATSDIKNIVFAKDASLQEKSNKLTAYVVDQAKPIIDEIYNYVNATKVNTVQPALNDLGKELTSIQTKAADKVDQATDKANGTIENHHL
ncbi:hypothetical protein CI109_100229 [Kwoniella shandongensis]|uniref:Uncharacterized protein n=1 Tax=Kwoniella shandongensis TaxID=1734106 RepID=A0A5M6BTT1_9TREE|nr:uncharacterized protein CI109_006236 [Kwoniella shandongensis]KAA5525432.1 hypothetical protein CI109_006236 [Kwoniella shandongensis]